MAEQGDSDLRAFIRDITRRNERVWKEQVTALRELRVEMREDHLEHRRILREMRKEMREDREEHRVAMREIRDDMREIRNELHEGRDENRAIMTALLRVLDRLPPPREGPAPAT